MKGRSKERPYSRLVAGFLAITVVGMVLNVWLLIVIASKWHELLRLLDASK